MARCADEQCGRWCPELLIRRGVGTRIDGRWFCSRACVEHAARRWLLDARPVAGGIPAVPPMRLGAILRHHGVVGAVQIEQALQAQRNSQLKLGEQLFAMGATEREPVLRALAAQAGVGYLTAVDVSSARKAPGGLSPHAVRALGLVPISELDEGRIRVACPAPVPRRALSAMRQLTGWTIEPYLVSDADFAALVDAYGTETSGDPTSRPVADFVQTESLLDAAAGIAAAATRTRSTTLTEARWDPYTWFRVHGQGVASDVVFSRPPQPVHQVEA